MTQGGERRGVRWRLGHIAQQLRKAWVLLFLQALAGIALAFFSFITFSNEPDEVSWIGWPTFALGVLAAVATGLDKIADQHAASEAKRQQEAEISAVTDSLTALLGLLDSAHGVAFAEGTARDARIDTLRASLADAAVHAPTAQNVRASYYSLVTDEGGWRELRDPKSRGRADEARTTFIERDGPGHPIWALMDAPDSASAIYEEPDPYPQVPWHAKPYKTFVSVPVAAGGVVFGMLSVNAPSVGDLREVDRLTVIAMARVMAQTLAMHEGPRKLSKRSK